jgi:hypothetical protein
MTPVRYCDGTSIFSMHSIGLSRKNTYVTTSKIRTGVIETVGERWPYGMIEKALPKVNYVIVSVKLVVCTIFIVA